MSQKEQSAPDPARVFGTFGIYRYFLSMLVMMGHIAYAKIAYAGDYAVFAFFVLSGYVVCYILHYGYLNKKEGLKKYAINRALRIYPPFLVASLFLLWLIVAFHVEKTPGIQSVMGYPETLHGFALIMWLALNLSALGSLPLLGAILTPAIMPVGWSLGVEIFYWSVLPLLMLRPRLAPYALGLALAYTAWVLALSIRAGHALMVMSYFSPLAGALPFIIGLYCFKRKLSGARAVPHALGITAILLLLGLIGLAPFLLADPFFEGFYPALALNTVIIAYLGRFDQRLIPAGLRRADSWLGDLAYPIFVLHVPVAMAIHVALPGLFHAHMHLFFLLAFLLTNGCAVLLHYALESPVNRLRECIKLS